VGGRDDRYPLASPIERLPLGRPSLLVHGLDDDVVPPSQSRRYRDAAVAAGDRCRLVELTGVGHYEHLDPTSPAWRIVREWLTQLW
jgi:pimeloyl-ACP methyl ester carboxylesterase